MTCSHRHDCGCGSLSNADIKAVIEGLLSTALDEKDFDALELKHSIYQNLLRIGDVQDKLNDFKADMVLNLSALITKTELASNKAELENLILNQQNIYEDLQRDFEAVTSQKLLDYKTDVQDIQQEVANQLNAVQSQLADLIPTRDAYKIAVQNGYVGSEASWLDSLKGHSAYTIAKAHGFRGSEAEWLSSLKGDKGDDGVDGKEGKSTYDISVGHGFKGSEREWLSGLANDTELVSNLYADAKSLSDFIYRPAGTKVSRRLAPSVDTLQFYIDSIEATVAAIPNTVNDAINNTAVEGGVLADTFVTATVHDLEAVARTQRDKNSEHISIKDFGAKGDGDQTVFTVPKYMTGRNKGFPITQQTADGIAINNAIRYLRSVGGGRLFVPKGEYRVYSYLEHIDFPLVLYGEGTNSLIKNCDDSPTDKNSYGLIIVQTLPEEGVQSEVIIRDILLDGNATNRVKPTKEFQLYPLVVYGWGGITLENVTSINSPIDCLNVAMDTGYEGKENHVTVSGCKFSNSYRNSVTVGKGENISFSQCLIEKGGFVHGGTNPRACLDMEPNISSSGNSVVWDSCTFKSAVNIVLAGVWTKSSFTNCTIDAGEIHPKNIDNDRDTFPWMGQLTAGQFDISNCSFIGRKDTMRSSFFHYNAGKDEQLYTDDSYLWFKGCSFDYCGINSTSRSIRLTDCQAQMSLIGWCFNGGNRNDECDVYIQNCHLKNVFASPTLSGGLSSSCSITAGVAGKVFVDGLNCIVDRNLLNKIPVELLTQYITSARGFGISPPHADDIVNERVVKNVYTAGFYRLLPDYMGVPRSLQKFRDWGSPNSPPMDSDLRIPKAVLTLKDDTVLKTDVLDEDGEVVSSTYKLKDTTILSELSYSTAPSTNSIVSLGAYTAQGTYYKNCTMWGDYDEIIVTE